MTSGTRHFSSDFVFTGLLDLACLFDGETGCHFCQTRKIIFDGDIPTAGHDNFVMRCYEGCVCIVRAFKRRVKEGQMTLISKLIAVIAILSVSACATITRGSDDVLVVKTTPSGAAVQVSNGMSCTATPCSIKMPRNSEVALTVTKKGCQTVQTNVTHKTADGGAAGMAGNVLVGGVIGLAVDAGTGATQDLVPNPVELNLRC